MAREFIPPPPKIRLQLDIDVLLRPDDNISQILEFEKLRTLEDVAKAVNARTMVTGYRLLVGSGADV